jgi:FSR family fosmidomycin resistance protein-like MFS transporter
MNRSAKFTITLLSTAHLVLDSYSSFLFPLLPLMATKLQLKPTQVGLLTPILMITSSLMQQVYGMISDRYLKRSMAVFGPLITAVFLSSIGLANSLPALLVIVICGGIGVGSFHPQSAAIVSRAAMSDGLGKHQGMIMSAFSSAGTVGYALGPLIIAAVVSRYGLEHSWYTMFWGVAMWLVMVKACPALEPVAKHADAPKLSSALRAAWVPLTLLYFAVVLRSAVSVSVQTFLPFALHDSGLTTTQVSAVLAGFLFFGGLGGFFWRHAGGSLRRASGFAGGDVAGNTAPADGFLRRWRNALRAVITGRNSVEPADTGQRRNGTAPGARWGEHCVGVDDGFCLGRGRATCASDGLVERASGFYSRADADERVAVAFGGAVVALPER